LSGRRIKLRRTNAQAINPAKIRIEVEGSGVPLCADTLKAIAGSVRISDELSSVPPRIVNNPL
jgi:hypothetical protein